MGLESHVDYVLEEAGLDHYWWHWSNGLNISCDSQHDIEAYAKMVMEILNDSGEFGPIRFNKETRKIEFGIYRDWWKKSRRFPTYKSYVKAFERFKTES